jgi:hypothetical protein
VGVDSSAPRVTAATGGGGGGGGVVIVVVVDVDVIGLTWIVS